jgi:uncharacterized protein YbjQ (UPF0145 family)
MDVQVYRQNTTLLGDCERIGNVSAEVSKFSTPSYWEKLEGDLRQAAADKGGDAVVIVNYDEHGLSSVSGQGVAYRCEA